MAQERVITIKLDSKQAQKNLDDLTLTLEEQVSITKEFEKELIQLEEQLKKTPKNSLAAQKDLKDKIDNLKNSIKDQKLAVKDLSDERKKADKVVKESTVVQADLTEEVTKNGGAMAILNQLTGGLAQQFKDSYEAIQLSSKGLKGFRAALVATGIGAAVVAIGLLAENWDKVKGALIGLTAEQQKYNEAVGEANVAANEASRNAKTLQELVLDESASYGARNQALNELKKLMPSINDLTLESANLTDKLTSSTNLYIEAVEARAKAEAFSKIIAEEEANIIREQNKALSEQVDTWDFLEAGIKSFGNATTIATQLAGEGIDKQNTKVEKSQQVIDALKTKYKESLTTALELENQIGATSEIVTQRIVQTAIDTTTQGLAIVGNFVTTLSETTANAMADLAKKNESNQIAMSDAELQRMENELKWAETSETEKAAIYAQGFNNLAAILGEESAAGKAAAIAGALISTYQSATDSYKSLSGIPIVGPALGFAAAGAAVSAGLANVKAIQSTKTPQIAGRGSANVSAPSTPSAPTPPQINVVGNTGTNQLADILSNQQPVKAYVVSSDVTTAQSLERNIVSSASI